jgi:hypothetical protein
MRNGKRGRAFWGATAILLVGLAKLAPLLADETVVPRREETMTAIQNLKDKLSPVPPSRALLLEIAGDEQDNSDRVTLRADFAGRFTRESSGNVEQISGFDGHECWLRDAVGLTKVLALADRDLLVFLSHFRTGQWLNHVTPEMLEIDPLATNAQVTTFAVHHHQATSRVEFDNATGLPSWFEIDGTQGRVRFGFSDYQRHFDLPKVQAGEAELAIGAIDWFELSGHRFENPIIIYSLAKSGPLAEPGVDGNIGVEFLKPFRILLDYRRARMAFVRTSDSTN